MTWFLVWMYIINNILDAADVNRMTSLWLLHIKKMIWQDNIRTSVLQSCLSCLTSETRRHRREYWERTLVQNASARRPRDSGRVLLARADSQRRRKATGSHCCYWRLETSAAAQIGQQKCMWKHVQYFTHGTGSRWESWDIMYLNVGQAFLQVGDYFRELRPVLKWKKQMLIHISAQMRNNPMRQTHIYFFCPAGVHFSPPAREAKVNSSKQSLDLFLSQ